MKRTSLYRILLCILALLLCMPIIAFAEENQSSYKLYVTTPLYYYGYEPGLRFIPSNVEGKDDYSYLYYTGPKSFNYGPTYGYMAMGFSSEIEFNAYSALLYRSDKSTDDVTISVNDFDVEYGPWFALAEGKNTFNVHVDKAGGTEDYVIQLVTPTTTAWENPFTDVDLTSDFYNGVAYCNQKGLIQGVSANTFDVDTLATRAMVVTILYRMEGSPTVSGENPFRDVKETDWFYAPVLWASQQGIVNGYDNGAFGASDAITREQLATILMRYAFTQVSNCLYSRLNGVTDVDSIAAYALESVREAVVMGILPVQDKQINPTGSVHRGDLAVAMAALAQNVLTIDKAMLNEYPKSCNYGHPAPLSGKWIQGTAFGTNSYTDGANNDTYDKAWDKDPSTFFDPAEAEPEERYTGIQTTEAYVLTEIRILPRYGWLDRFKGASIQGSNDGKTWTTLWTSESEATEWDYQIISADKIENNTGYTVFRYVNMINHGDVAEIELFGTVKE